MDFRLINTRTQVSKFTIDHIDQIDVKYTVCNRNLFTFIYLYLLEMYIFVELNKNVFERNK